MSETLPYSDYSEYRDSEIRWLGEIPSNWETTRIKFVARLESGHTPSRSKSEYWDGDIPWFSLADIYKIREYGQRFISETEEYITEAGIQNSGARLLPEGTVVLSRTASVGFACILGVPAATDQSMVNWVCGPYIESEYLYYVFRSMDQEFERLARGSTHETIYMPDMGQLSTPLPPLKEQRKIVSFLNHNLSRADSLIEKKEILLSLLEEKKSGVISEAVTRGTDSTSELVSVDSPFFDKIPSNWDLVPLKYTTPDITVGIVQKPKQYYVDNGVPALRSLNLNPGEIVEENLKYISEESNSELSKSKLNEGDLVAVRSGDPGTTAVIPEHLDGVNCIDLIIIREPTDYLSKYLSLLMNSRVAKSQIEIGTEGAAQQHFNVSDAKNLIFPQPPLDEQEEIFDKISPHISTIEESREKIEQSIELLQEKRESLITNAVTGKIDLRDWEKDKEMEISA